jgi:hypothetical protein
VLTDPVAQLGVPQPGEGDEALPRGIAIALNESNLRAALGI